MERLHRPSQYQDKVPHERPSSLIIPAKLGMKLPQRAQFDNKQWKSRTKTGTQDEHIDSQDSSSNPDEDDDNDDDDCLPMS